MYETVYVNFSVSIYTQNSKLKIGRLIRMQPFALVRIARSKGFMNQAQ